MALKVGDSVSVAVKCFGAEYAKSHGGRQWQSEAIRDEGVVKGKDGAGDWLVDFGDGAEVKAWKRKILRFEARAADPDPPPPRPGATRATAVSAVSGDDSSDGGGAAEKGAEAMDSSDEEFGAGEAGPRRRYCCSFELPPWVGP